MDILECSQIPTKKGKRIGLIIEHDTVMSTDSILKALSINFEDPLIYIHTKYYERGISLAWHVE